MPAPDAFVAGIECRQWVDVYLSGSARQPNMPKSRLGVKVGA